MSTPTSPAAQAPAGSPPDAREATPGSCPQATISTGTVFSLMLDALNRGAHHAFVEALFLSLEREGSRRGHSNGADASRAVEHCDTSRKLAALIAERIDVHIAARLHKERKRQRKWRRRTFRRVLLAFILCFVVAFGSGWLLR